MASKIANDALMVMSVVAMNNEKQATDSYLENTNEKIISAIALIKELINNIDRKHQSSEEEYAKLVYVLLARAVGDKSLLRSKLDSCINEMQYVVEGKNTKFDTSLSTLSEICEASQELVESSRIELESGS
jgi:hypothetical protein